MPPGSRERVLVRRVTRLAEAVAESLDFLDHDFRGLKVWVKPNLISPHPPERSVTTDPELVRAVVRELGKRGAEEITVADNPGGNMKGNIESYLEPTGIVEASEGCFRGVSGSPVELEVDSPVLDSIHVSRILLEADVILNLPVFKAHAFTVMSGAVKNMFGMVPGGQKGRLHALVPDDERFAELIVDLYRAIPTPMLHLMDAQRGMDGSGPSAGRARDIGCLLAARNGVALDSVMALMAGIEPTDVPMLRCAGTRELGPVARDGIDIVGDFHVVPDFRIPSRRLSRALTGVVARIYPLARSRPVLVEKLCTRCGMCAASCPVDALNLSPLPRISRDDCITCYCCTEVCPEQALHVPGPWRGFVHELGAE
jgi:uncharacterized protein (DUF362 family)/NAD-dependent dihydropyrimidine dehydrogenase PreA subunit